MAGKPCERVEGHDCGKTELPDVMECITADERTPGEANQCFDLHKDLLS